MIRTLILLLLASPAVARGIDHGPSPYERGQIADFYRNPYLSDQPVGWAVIIEQRIWNGDEWLPLASRRGADFFRQYEQEIRDGQTDAE